MSAAAQPPDPRLCPCGSGLSRARCCELNLATLGAPEANRHLQPLEDQALEAWRAGDTAKAEALVLDVLELAPRRIPSLSLLYEIRKAQMAGQASAQVPSPASSTSPGRPAAATVTAGNASAALIRRMVALDPNNFWAINEVTLLLLSRGEFAEALRHARNAVRIAPDAAQAHYLLGMALTETHRPAVGEYHYTRAIELAQTRAPVVLANLALCLKNQGKMQAARALYTEALAAAPDNLHTLLGFARLEEADRDLPAALALLDRAGAQQPQNPSVRLLRAMVLGRRGETAAALALLDELAGSKAELGPGEYLEKGRLLDRLGRYDEAFAAFDAGKKRLRELTGQTYLDTYADQHLKRLANFFIAKRLRTFPAVGRPAAGAQPLFVLGFPRSGTTLLEQMLSAHPRICAGDELPFIAELTNLMPRMLESPLAYPECLAELWMGDHREDLDALRDHYLRKVAQLGIVPEGRRWFTDKMPLNETDLGLISMLFPESPLLHVVRHPLDVVLSVYSNLLTHGYFCAYALESAATHYLRVMDLVDHYRREMELFYLQVRYEDLVGDQEGTLRRVLAFAGEEFDPACLAFHENKRYARTASYAQVTEKLYDRARYRYKNYLPQLEPVIPLLRPVIERLGYSI